MECQEGVFGEGVEGVAGVGQDVVRREVGEFFGEYEGIVFETVVAEVVGVFVAQVDVETVGGGEEADEGAFQFFGGGDGATVFLVDFDITCVRDEVGEVLLD